MPSPIKPADFKSDGHFRTIEIVANDRKNFRVRARRGYYAPWRNRSFLTWSGFSASNLMPGYSGTPLPKKLGIKPGFRVYLADAPAEVRAELSKALAECKPRETGTMRWILQCCSRKSRVELTKEFSRLAKLLAPAGMLWVSWPKKSSGVTTDLDENGVREIGLGAGLGGCKGLRRDRGMVRIEVRAAGEGSKKNRNRRNDKGSKK